MNGHALYTDILTSPADDTLMPGAVVKTIVADLLGELRAAMHDLGGADCGCLPLEDEFDGVPVEELERDLREDEVDRTDCVWHDPSTQALYLLGRCRNVMDRWEAPR